MTQTQPTRICEVIRLNRKIDVLVAERNATTSRVYRKHLDAQIKADQATRDALELGLYEGYGITVDR